MTITSALLTETIEATLADWIAAGRVTHASQVGNGFCYEFAEEVMTRLDSTEYGDGYMPADSFGRLVDVCTEDWWVRSEEPTSELQSLMRISYAVFCLKKKHIITHIHYDPSQNT